MNQSLLLADPQALALESLTSKDTQAILVAKTINSIALCPKCHQPSSRIHSRYQRTVADLPCLGVSVQLQLLTRRFFCINKTCVRRIFCERLPRVVAAYGRQTVRLNDALLLVGMMLGGQAGAKLAMGLGMPQSPDTILRRIHQSRLAVNATPRVLGVDDWAWRKGRRYGTILVDLERHRLIELLPDREASTLTNWLSVHPGVEVVTRDRSKAYESGIRQGAPMAIQVADRFHLLQNLAETLAEAFGTHSQALKTVGATHSLSAVISSESTAVVPVLPPQPLPKEQRIAQERRSRREADYKKVWELHRSGWLVPAIARQVGIGRTTVFRYLRSSTFPERQGRRDCGRSRLLDPYKDYVLERWNNGCHDTLHLFGEIKERGYSGSYDTVARYTRRFRTAQGTQHRFRRRSIKQLPKVSEPQKLALTPRRAAHLVLRRPENWEPDDEQLVQRMAQHPELAEAIQLAQNFAFLVRQRQPDSLDSWLDQALGSQLSPFHRFAKRLQEDYDAVKAGVTLPWSNGQTEGQINRLKMLKRQMYGRAGMKLLERRFLLAV
jgi:transposase